MWNTKAKWRWLENHLDVKTAKACTNRRDSPLSQSVTGKLEVNILLWSRACRAYILMDPLTKQCALIRTTDLGLKQATETKDAICAQIHATPDNE